jgi:hypothetical protein
LALAASNRIRVLRALNKADHDVSARGETKCHDGSQHHCFLSKKKAIKGFV